MLDFALENRQKIFFPVYVDWKLSLGQNEGGRDWNLEGQVGGFHSNLSTKLMRPRIKVQIEWTRRYKWKKYFKETHDRSRRNVVCD